jgi:predicted  nucleic acid-binding Zn-ribbon protein
MSRRHEYVEKIKRQLDEMNAKIDELQTRKGQAEGRAKEEYQERLAAFRERADMARAKLREIRESPEDSWEGLKAEMEKIREALVHSYRYFKSQL